MKRGIKTALVFAGTIVILIVIFWVVLPMLGVDEMIGSSYFIVTIVGSLILSYGISHLLNKLFFRKG